MTVDPLLQLVLAMPLALLFISASQHKRSESARFEAQLTAYGLLPREAGRWVARILPWLELGTGLALIVPLTRPAAGVAAATLLTTYALAIAINIIRGRTAIDCGCGGPAQPLSLWLVLRNGLLAGAALLLMLPAASRPLQSLDAFALLLLTALLALCYLTLGQLLHNRAALGDGLAGGHRHDA